MNSIILAIIIHHMLYVSLVHKKHVRHDAKYTNKKIIVTDNSQGVLHFGLNA